VNVNEMAVLAREVAVAYDQVNKQQGRGAWTVDNYMAGLVGDVGDLSKLVMAKSGYREIADVDGRLSHELADCLWSLLLIADELEIDLAVAFKDSMETLVHRVRRLTRPELAGTLPGAQSAD
jgi:NTP pyrophosphatase (non-canonical NTP hydrolase)